MSPGRSPAEMDVVTGAALGNFPQAFTHVGLINAVLTIEQQEQAGALT